MAWRTLRVVVEVPVEGDYTAKDLAWDVRRCIGDSGGILFRKSLAHSNVKTGRIEVKEYDRVRTAERLRVVK
jgi:hypothetical protein